MKPRRDKGHTAADWGVTLLDSEDSLNVETARQDKDFADSGRLELPKRPESASLAEKLAPRNPQVSAGRKSPAYLSSAP